MTKLLWLAAAALAAFVAAAGITRLVLRTSPAVAPTEQVPIRPTLDRVTVENRLWMPSGQPWQDFLAAAALDLIPEGMVWVPGSEFWMGDDEKTDDGRSLFPDAPRHLVRVDG